jgi:SET domain-containing protein
MIRDVEVRDAGSKGRGVFARRAFRAGEFVFRRRHVNVVTADDLDRLDDWERMHLCELGFDRFAVLAPPGCYLNHSCDPNAMRHGVKVFAWRPIAAGEEVTIASITRDEVRRDGGATALRSPTPSRRRHRRATQLLPHR